jgi:16S rRNA (guanine527-N7)-methyltransferase
MRRVKDFVSREAYAKIIEYEKLLLKWNKTINLVSAKTLQDITNRHILDSLQLLMYMDKDSKVIDLGSGAGFPAIILSIAGVDVVRQLF